MSYILDALTRADTERERGAAPGLHTRHQMPAGNAGIPSERRPVWMAAAAGLTLVVLAIVFWFWRTPDAPPMAALKPAASTMPKLIAPEQPAISAAPVPPAAPVEPSAPPAAITPIAPVPIVATEAPVARAKPVEKTSPKAVTAQPVIPTAPAASAGAVAVAPAAATASAAATAAVPTSLPSSARPASTTLLGDLPADLRSQIPKITITGSVYSDSPAQRLLLVNNLVLSQGSQITPDLRLEEIQPRSSVFSFKGTRFRVMH